MSSVVQKNNCRNMISTHQTSRDFSVIFISYNCNIKLSIRFPNETAQREKRTYIDKYRLSKRFQPTFSQLVLENKIYNSEQLNNLDKHHNTIIR